MKTHKQTVHLYFELSGGKHTVFRSGDMAKNYPTDYILLASQEVEFVIEKSDDDLTRAQVEGLQDAKQKVLADAHVKAALIDQQIQSLLAIAHEPSEAA